MFLLFVTLNTLIYWSYFHLLLKWLAAIGEYINYAIFLLHRIRTHDFIPMGVRSVWLSHDRYFFYLENFIAMRRNNIQMDFESYALWVEYEFCAASSLSI